MAKHWNPGIFTVVSVIGALLFLSMKHRRLRTKSGWNDNSPYKKSKLLSIK